MTNCVEKLPASQTHNYTLHNKRNSLVSALSRRLQRQSDSLNTRCVRVRVVELQLGMLGAAHTHSLSIKRERILDGVTPAQILDQSPSAIGFRNVGTDGIDDAALLGSAIRARVGKAVLGCALWSDHAEGVVEVALLADFSPVVLGNVGAYCELPLLCGESRAVVVLGDENGGLWRRVGG